MREKEWKKEKNVEANSLLCLPRSPAFSVFHLVEPLLLRFIAAVSFSPAQHTSTHPSTNTHTRIHVHSPLRMGNDAHTCLFWSETLGGSCVCVCASFVVCVCRVSGNYYQQLGCEMHQHKRSPWQQQNRAQYTYTRMEGTVRGVVWSAAIIVLVCVCVYFLSLFLLSFDTSSGSSSSAYMHARLCWCVRSVFFCLFSVCVWWKETLIAHCLCVHTCVWVCMCALVEAAGSSIYFFSLFYYFRMTFVILFGVWREARAASGKRYWNSCAAHNIIGERYHPPHSDINVEWLCVCAFVYGE